MDPEALERLFLDVEQSLRERGTYDIFASANVFDANALNEALKGRFTASNIHVNVTPNSIMVRDINKVTLDGKYL